jgi:HAMP domain-containing protein
MLGKRSILLKYNLVFLITVVIVAAALFAGLSQLKTRVLRNEAQAVANQVVSFRAWVAKSGMMWVDELSSDFHEFLARREAQDGKVFYGKNPALATRELSTLVNRSAQRATFRVTSDDFRNPLNEPDAFEKRAIMALKADSEARFYEGFRRGTYRYAQPIKVKKACLRCHGDPRFAPKEVVRRYGDERAFNYKVGDVRGVISVSLPDITVMEASTTLVNPVTLGLLALAFLINYLATQRGISRLKRLTGQAEAIAKGDLETDLGVHKGSRDEIHQATHAVSLLRNSLKVAMRRMEGK